MLVVELHPVFQDLTLVRDSGFGDRGIELGPVFVVFIEFFQVVLWIFCKLIVEYKDLVDKVLSFCILPFFRFGSFSIPEYNSLFGVRLRGFDFRTGSGGVSLQSSAHGSELENNRFRDRD